MEKKQKTYKQEFEIEWEFELKTQLCFVNHSKRIFWVACGRPYPHGARHRTNRAIIWVRFLCFITVLVSCIKAYHGVLKNTSLHKLELLHDGVIWKTPCAPWCTCPNAYHGVFCKVQWKYTSLPTAASPNVNNRRFMRNPYENDPPHGPPPNCPFNIRADTSADIGYIANISVSAGILVTRYVLMRIFLFNYQYFHGYTFYIVWISAQKVRIFEQKHGHPDLDPSVWFRCTVSKSL